MSTVYVSRTGRHSAYKEFFPFDLYEMATRSKRAVIRDGHNTSRKLQDFGSVSSMFDLILLQQAVFF